MDQTAEIKTTAIGPIAVADCEADQGGAVSLTIADADEDEATFTDGVDADFQFGAQGITITGQNGEDLDLQDLNTGTVVSSTGITCEAEPVTNGGGGGTGEGGAGTGRTAAEVQYNIVKGSTPDREVLANTSGPSLLGLAVISLAVSVVGISVLTGGLRR